MSLKLSFDKIVKYDPGLPGISLEVELRVGGISVLIPTKVDTGSTRCVFSRIYAEKLGLKIESGEPQIVGTPTGSFQAFGHSVTLIAADYIFDSLVLFAQDASFNRNVLGRHGWLDQLVIGIIDYDGKLYLRRYDG